MYIDPKLFSSASEEFSTGLDLLNSCKREILNYSGIKGDSFDVLESAISACNATKLDDIIKNTTSYLCNESDEFRAAYQSLISDKMNSGIENLSSTEYNFLAEQNEYLILQQLQQYDEEGKLTEEGKQMLKYQELKIANIEIAKKMSGMATTDPEYVDLYAEYIKNQEEMLKLEPNKTEEEKKAALSEHQKNSAYTLEVLSLGRDIDLKGDELKELEQGTSEYYKKQNEQLILVNALYDKQISYLESLSTINADTLIQLGELREKKHTTNQYIELNNLYLSGASADVIAEKKVEMGIANNDEQDLYDWNNMNWLEKAWEHTKTVGATVYTSLASIGENLIDGALMLTVGTVGRLGNDAAAKWTEEFTSFNYADYTYDSFVKDGGLNNVSAYSAVHKTTDFLATTGGYICLSLIPGAGGTAVMAVAGGGSATQTAFDNGATFNEAWGSTVINAGLSAVADVGLDKVNASKTLSTLQKTGLRTLIGAGEPGLNMVSEYFLYGRDNSSDFVDYGIKSGGFLNMFIGSSVANGAGFFQDFKTAKNLDLSMKDIDAKAKTARDILKISNADDFSKAIKGVDDITLGFVLKDMNSNSLKNLVENIPSDSLSRVVNNLDDVNLKKLAKVLTPEKSAIMLNVMSDANASKFISGLDFNNKAKVIEMTNDIKNTEMVDNIRHNINAEMSVKTDVEKTKAWTEYFNQKYGSAEVENYSYGELNARKTATDNFLRDSWISKNVPVDEFKSKLKTADEFAERFSGIMDKKTFYEVWGAPKGLKPDPSTYLPDSYIKNHLALFSDGASRFNTPSEVDFHKAAHTRPIKGGNDGFVGYRNTYDVMGVSQINGSEFVSTSKNVDDIVSAMSDLSDSNAKAEHLNEVLGLPGKFAAGAYRYDIDSDALKGLDLRLPSGNEPGAWAMDWLPGGFTSGGTPEAVVNAFLVDGKGINLNQLF